MKKWMRKICFGILFLLLLFSAVLFINVGRFSSKQISALIVPVNVSNNAVDKLANAIPFKTISFENTKEINYQEFLRFHEYLEASFPVVHRKLKREVINSYSLLYTWQGKNDSLKPCLFMAHMDVVPAAEGKDRWEFPPFSGKVTDTHIWGRGTMDDKGMIISILEASEMLLKEDFVPERTIYFCFGHDEEIGGVAGTKQVCSALQSRGVELEFVLDEGLVVTQNIIAGIEKPVALIAIAEKGNVSLQLKVSENGGHSSMPEYPSSIGVLSKAIAKLESNLLPARIDGPTQKMFDYLGAEMPFVNKLIIANLYFFESLMISQLEKSPSTSAVVRTTTATTIIRAGEKENVLPIDAMAVVNFRILPGDSVQAVKKMVQDIIDDPKVTVEIYGEDQTEPSIVSSVETISFANIQKSICQVFPEVVVAPGLMVGQTDSRHFSPICKNIYRFAPMLLFPEDTNRFHGINERISIENYKQCIQFFYHLIQNSQN